jgi:hypothetical protein
LVLQRQLESAITSAHRVDHERSAPPRLDRAARRRGGEALERLVRSEWPAASVVSRLVGTWATARAAARRVDAEVT